MKSKIFIAVVMFFTTIGMYAQPPAIQNLLNTSEFSDRPINQIGHITKNVKFNRLVGWHGVSTHFGIVGDASGGRVLVVAIDPNLEGSSDIDNAILYGAYSDESGINSRGENDWQVDLFLSSDWWNRTDTPLTKSTDQNRCSYNAERQSGSQLQGLRNWAWGQHTLDMKIYAIAFGKSELANFKFQIPGVYDDITWEVIEGSDLIRGREYKEILWTRIGESYRSAMAFKGNEVKLRKNQTEAQHGDQGTESIMFEMWGKALFSTKKIHPNINSAYSYGLWVEKAMVSEDFIMHPKEGWADYVFEAGYELPELDQVEAYIQQHKHLPNMPSEKEVIDHGYSQHEINVRLLQNIEQLTLHKIRQQAEIEESTHQLAEQRKQMEKVRNLLGGGD